MNCQKRFGAQIKLLLEYLNTTKLKKPLSFLECSDFINRFDLEVKPTFFGMSKAGGGGRGEPIINYCTLIVSFTISPLQLAIHEVQNRHPGK